MKLQSNLQGNFSDLCTRAKKSHPWSSLRSATASAGGPSLALTSKEHYRIPFEPVMPGVSFLEYGDIQAATKLIRSGKIAAVFLEPIQGEGGIYSATKEFLEAFLTACDSAGALLVFDEVQCGLGRAGYLLAHEAYGVYPDMMTLAKPLAGGLPIGAVLASERVAGSINF